MIQIKKKKVEGFVVISLKGDMGTYEAENFEEELTKIINKERLDIIIDLKGLEYISSSGLRALLALRDKLVKEGKRLFLASLNEKILDIFRVAKLLAMFEICKDIKEALGR